VGRVGLVLSGVAFALIFSWLRLRGARLPGVAADYLGGATFSVVVFFLLCAQKSVAGSCTRLLRGLAQMSYTLYAVHTPLLVLCAAFAFRHGESRWSIDPGHLAAAGAIVSLVFALAWLIYKGTEEKTKMVRAWVEKAVAIVMPASASVPPSIG
jgi:peptidoglycan/LPS O-acetylase OafA/YrhL